MIITVTAPNDFDVACRSARSAGDEIVLKTDAFTRGSWNNAPGHIQIANGVKLHGEGHTIHLDNPNIFWKDGKDRPNRDVAILQVGDNVFLEDVTIHGHEDKYRTGDPKTWLFIKTGVHSFGTLTAAGVTVKGIRGTVAGKKFGLIQDDIEAFGFLTNGVAGGSQLTDCEVKECPGNASVDGETYISAFVIGHADQGQPCLQSLLTRCNVNIERTWCAFSASNNVLLRSCSVRNVRTAANFDTLVMKDVLFEDCDCLNILQGPSLVSTDGSFKGDIVFRKCRFTGPMTHMLSFWDQYDKGGVIGSLVFDRCTFEVPDSCSPLINIVAPKARPVVFNQCVMPKNFKMPTDPAYHPLVVIS